MASVQALEGSGSPMARLGQSQPEERQPQVLGYGGEHRGGVGAHEEAGEEHGVLALAACGGRDEVREGALVGAYAAAGWLVACQRAATEGSTEPAKVRDRSRRGVRAGIARAALQHPQCLVLASGPPKAQDPHGLRAHRVQLVEEPHGGPTAELRLPGCDVVGHDVDSSCRGVG